MCYSIKLTKDVFYFTVLAVTNREEGTQSTQFVFRERGWVKRDGGGGGRLFENCGLIEKEV